MPFLVRGDGLRFIGYSDETPGAYGEYIRLTESLLLEVPNGVSPTDAALTEPMAVGVHAVEKARLDKKDVPLVHWMRAHRTRSHCSTQSERNPPDRRG